MLGTLALRLVCAQQPLAAAATPALRLLASSIATLTPSQPSSAPPAPWSLPQPSHPAHAPLRQPSSARWMSQCSCPGLGGPPPERLFIEYDPEDVEAFIAVADGIEDLLPGVIVDGNVDGDGRPASFEVTAPDGTVVFSRLEAGRLPSAQELASAFAPPADS